MSAYVIVYYSSITDVAAMKEYAKLAGPSLQKHGARPLALNVPGAALEGSQSPLNVVLLQFSSAEAAKQWYESPEYREAAAHRASAAILDMVLVEGLPAKDK